MELASQKNGGEDAWCHERAFGILAAAALKFAFVSWRASFAVNLGAGANTLLPAARVSEALMS